MNILLQHRRKIALFLLMLMFLEVVHSPKALGLTSGPVQPEMKGFEPAGISNMVNLFTGDFNYNIPLLDVGGYPVNLVYHSGMGIEDEASWVGFGWSLSAGSINRQLRGLPDDFNGTSASIAGGDSVTRIMNKRPEIRAGLGARIKGEIIGIPVKGSFSAEIYNDNYWGIGAQIGANAGLSLGKPGSGILTAGLGIRTDSHSGVDVTPTLNFSIGTFAADNLAVNMGLSVGFPYNSRSGLRGMTLGQSFGYTRYGQFRFSQGIGTGSFLSFAGQAYTPQITLPTKTTSFTASVDIGAVFGGIYGGGGVSGDYFKKGLARHEIKNPAYGYLYAANGKKDRSALMDMNREKDGPFIKEDPYLPIPVNTYDLYSVSNQNGVSQFRLKRGSTGILFDPQNRSVSTDNTFGAEAGIGDIIQVGADYYHQSVSNTSGKWIKNNDFRDYGDFSAYNFSHPEREPVYFKKVGETTPLNNDFADLLHDEIPLKVAIGKDGDYARAEAMLKDKYNKTYPVNIPLQRAKRDKRNSTLSFLTASMASFYGLDTALYSYPYNQLVLGACTTPPVAINRVSDIRKPFHISEITETDESGKRFVYGIPVYNLKQEEVTFSVSPGTDANRASGHIAYTAGGFNPDNSILNNKGRAHYYSKQSLPPYATSYLLTGILSPDYVDKTGDGITDDDPGTAVKFNYTKVNGTYKWRSPYAKNSGIASYNIGMMSDPKDDKASYVYGEKELWYLHSIESKTMIAQFILEDRADALGVAGENGGKSTAVHQKLLKEIRLYSKSDLVNQSTFDNAIPIKTVHFVYNYDICRGVPNAAHGKLTLKRVYFTFGANNRGKLHPYIFDYNNSDTTSSNNRYELQAYDRWGTFKDSAANPNGLLNSEYPYTLQDSALDAAYAGKWQLDKITLPTGGVIQVTYESDDYAYVQNKRAMQMFTIKDVNGSTNGDGLIDAPYIEVGLPDGITDIKQLTEGIDYLYFKCLVDLDRSHREFVPGYAKVKKFELSDDKKTLRIYFDMDPGDPNPIAKAAWQFFRTNLPQYVYPGYDNLSPDESNFKKAILALGAALHNLKELTENFNERARRQGYANKLTPGKSWVRLCSPFYKKLGGGSRVKKLQMSDQWQNMSGASGALSAAYGQDYRYTTTLKNAQGDNLQISSGVASYEPMLGGDENPFRQPVFYDQKVPFALTNYYYKELPVCETYYPAPVVGYSKVTVRNIGADGSMDKTGYTVNEFYTARDFPTIVEATPIKVLTTKSSFILNLFGAEVKNGVAVSQGYSVELNDMHGKPKSVAVYDAGGGKISSVNYSYKTENPLAETKELDNTVQVLQPDGTITSATLSQGIDMVTDMREQQMENLGQKIQASAGFTFIWIFPWFYGSLFARPNNEYRTYNSTATVKVIHKYGILQKVTKMQNGSTITTENLLWDSETGKALLTKTENEFDDPVYSFTYPAHWAYPGMGQAYRNMDMRIVNISVDAYGRLLIDGSISEARKYLFPGDELAGILFNNKYWVSRDENGDLIAIDSFGDLAQIGPYAQIIRTGRRNMASVPVGTLVSLVNPVKNGKLDISGMSQILDAKAVSYSEEWPVPVSCNSCAAGYTLSDDGTYCYKDVPATRTDTFNVCIATDPAYSMYGSYIYDPGYCVDGVTNFSRHRFAPNNPYWVGENECCTVDTFENGDCGGSASLTAQSAQLSSGHNVKETVSAYDQKSNMIAPNAIIEEIGPMNRSGIWACTGDEPYGEWIGVSESVYFPESKTYYFGIGGDNEFRARIDGNYFINRTTGDSADFNNVASFRVWHIYPVYVTQGDHIISVEGLNQGAQASFGMQVYNNTLAEMAAATSSSDLDIIFNTRDFAGGDFTTDYSCPAGATLISNDGSPACRYIQPHNQYKNPYLIGLLGNWRPRKQYVYQVNRIPYDTTVTNSIRKAGYYTAFNPFWIYDNTSANLFVPDTTNWTWSSEITHYNRKGMETEERDALGRYSAALFGYEETAPVMVASNSQEKDLVYDGFEDYVFKSSCQSILCTGINSFDFASLIDHTTVDTVRRIAHTGNYSLKLDGSATLAIPLSADNNEEGPLYSFDEMGRLVPNDSKMIRGFSPAPGKKYLISLWINDGNNSPNTSFRVSLNGVGLLNTAASYPVVEGWKKIEVPFTVANGGGNEIQLSFNSGGATVYLDDIRIHPYDGQAKTFVYDARTQRLMAGLDENNFATFYEYDDKGILVRVKKETEKGIVTVKETRSSYKMNGQ